MSRSAKRTAYGVALAAAIVALSGIQDASAAPSALKNGDVQFSRDIRPILTSRCSACHGPDAAARKGGLRLDEREFATRRLASGNTAVVPGTVDASELVRRILHADPDEVMPPAATKKPLTQGEKDLLVRWVREGAPYDRHWAFLRPVRGTPPIVGSAAWPRNEIDHFVLARLEAEGMKPSIEASRDTLVRRVSLDLRGLPPTLDEIDAFVKDPAPNAYESMVDRMLASQHYGERLALDWLDLARYGDTNGFHSDSERAMWLYRNYVVDAFNAGKPYDQFIQENIAGDLLPNATVETQIASGFNRCNTFNEEGGADPAEFSVAYAVDRTNTTGQVFLGLTVGCAQCHDHKYDPISQREYYQLYAFFNSVDGEIGAGGQVGHHGKPLPPLLHKPSPDQAAQHETLVDEYRLVEAEVRRQLRRTELPEGKAFASALARWTEDLVPLATASDIPLDGLRLWLDASDINGNGQADVREDRKPQAQITTWRDRSAKGHEMVVMGTPTLRPEGIGGRACVEFDGDQDFLYHPDAGADVSADFTVFAVYEYSRIWKTQTLIQWGGKKVRSLEKRGRVHPLTFGSKPGDIETLPRLSPNRPFLAVVSWKATDAHVQLNFDGVSHGKVEAKLESTDGGRLAIGANLKNGRELHGSVAEILVYSRTLTPEETAGVGAYLSEKYKLETEFLGAEHAILDLARHPGSERNPYESRRLRDAFVQQEYPATQAIFEPLERRLKELQLAREKLEYEFPSTMVMVTQKMRTPAFVLTRGDFQLKGEEVRPDVPAIFPKLPSELPRNRLGLAAWLTRPDHPLVARVTVNRLWKQLFGTGIVKTLGDFGTQGEWPSHRALLDWLAVEFVESGWDVKALHRRLLLSATYRQSSTDSKRYQDQDAYNRFLSRAPRFRLSAEEIRDVALAISGLLDRRIGGKSVKPYQPEDYYTDKVGSSWKLSEGGDLYRRGLYTYWRRTTLFPAFQIFDAPSREVCTVNRPRTNTPLQALALLNDLTYVEAARVFAERTLRQGGDRLEERLIFAFRQATARPPRQEELEALEAIYLEQVAVQRENPEDARLLVQNGKAPVPEDLEPTEFAAWTALCSVLLNLDETITRE